MSNFKTFLLKLILQIENKLIKKPVISAEFSKEIIKEILTPYCKDIMLHDRVYCSTTKKEMKDFIQNSLIDTFDYYSEWYDCDNFAFSVFAWLMRFGSYTLFEARTKSHAFNLFIDCNKNVYIVEPQKNKFYNIKDNFENQYKDITFIIC